MPASVGVLALHGMGNPAPSFAEGMFAALIDELGPIANNVAFETCYWSPILQRQQDVTWERLRNSGPMDQQMLRRWVVNALGDPVSYLSGYLESGRPAYDAVHECLRASLSRLEHRLIDGDRPLVVLAHSLAGVVVSNYVWNEQRASNTVRPTRERTPPNATASGTSRAVGRTPFERMERLLKLVTYGCNIPLFLPPSPPIECIVFPPPQLPQAWKASSRWINVYDPDDVLGYPIAKIWDDDKGTFIDDVALDVGPWPLGETPLAHSLYDRDPDFIRLVAAEIRLAAHLGVTAGSA